MRTINDQLRLKKNEITHCRCSRGMILCYWIIGVFKSFLKERHRSRIRLLIQIQASAIDVEPTGFPSCAARCLHKSDLRLSGVTTADLSVVCGRNNVVEQVCESLTLHSHTTAPKDWFTRRPQEFTAIGTVAIVRHLCGGIYWRASLHPTRVRKGRDSEGSYGRQYVVTSH